MCHLLLYQGLGRLRKDGLRRDGNVVGYTVKIPTEVFGISSRSTLEEVGGLFEAWKAWKCMDFQV